MKHYLLFTLFSCLFIPLVSFASIESCQPPETGDVPYKHCTYFTGFNKDDLSDGRYIKIEQNFKDQRDSFTFCMNDTTILTLDDDEATELLGDDKAAIIHNEFFICTDKSGSNCHSITKSAIDIIKTGLNIEIRPRLKEIPLASLINQYPRCNAQIMLLPKKTQHHSV